MPPITQPAKTAPIKIVEKPGANWQIPLDGDPNRKVKGKN